MWADYIWQRPRASTVCNKSPVFIPEGDMTEKKVSETKEWKHGSGNRLEGFYVRAVSKVLKYYVTQSLSVNLHKPLYSH